MAPASNARRVTEHPEVRLHRSKPLRCQIGRFPHRPFSGFRQKQSTLAWRPCLSGLRQLGITACRSCRMKRKSFRDQKAPIQMLQLAADSHRKRYKQKRSGLRWRLRTSVIATAETVREAMTDFLIRIMVSPGPATMRSIGMDWMPMAMRFRTQSRNFRLRNGARRRFWACLVPTVPGCKPDSKLPARSSTSG